MRSRLTRLAIAVAALAALAIGGSALATAAHKRATPAASANAAKTHVVRPAQSARATSDPGDGDNVQQGDQSAADTSAEASDPAGASEPADAADPANEQASESGPSDGPGGYADTSANADTQQEGQH